MLYSQLKQPLASAKLSQNVLHSIRHLKPEFFVLKQEEGSGGCFGGPSRNHKSSLPSPAAVRCVAFIHQSLSVEILLGARSFSVDMFKAEVIKWMLSR